MSSGKFNYAALAAFFNSYPEVLAIRRFRELQIRNLLFYQAELAHLEADLHKIELEDATQQQDPLEHFTFRWTPYEAQDVKAGVDAPCPGIDSKNSARLLPPSTTAASSSAYREKVLQIRYTLAKFNEAVEQYRQLSCLPTPRQHNMTAIHDWLNDMNLGAAFLAGDVEDVWTVELGDGKSKAAIAKDFYSFQDQSGLAFFIGSIIAWIHRAVFRDTITSVRRPHFINTSVYSVLDQGITTVAASILPVLPILVFYFVKDLLVRIALIFLFTTVFSAVLVMGFQVKPHATLAITTALAAIQVVYVGSTAGDGKPS